MCILKTVLVPNNQAKLKTCKELKNLHKQTNEKSQRSARGHKQNGRTQPQLI